MPDRKHTSKQICETFDVKPLTLKRWRARGLPCTAKGGGYLYDEAEVAAWRKEHNLTGDIGRPATPMSQELAAIKLRKETAMCEKHELDLEREIGALIHVEDAKQAIAEVIAVAKAAFINLPAAVSAQFVGLDAASIQDILTTRITEILSAMAQHGFTPKIKTGNKQSK